MPNTRTSDVAQALPSAIDGPFVVANPADQTSTVKIDPAQARITTTGSARPVKRITLGYIRTAGTTSSAMLISAMSCRQVAVGNDGGFHTAVLQVPLDMDLAEPVSVYVLIAPANSSSLTGAVVRVEVTADYAKHGQASPHNMTVTYDYTVPDSWQQGSVEIPLVDDGAGRTFAPNTFETGDVVGLRVRLLRSVAADTFDQAVNLASGAVLEYTGTAI